MKIRQWLKKHFAYNTMKIFDEKAWKYLRTCGNILDVGCGNGRFIALSPKQIRGIDKSQEAVNFCRQQGFQVVMGDALDLPFEDGCFNGVHCSHLIEHLHPEDAWQLLRQLTRVLEPGGILCLRAPLMTRNFHHDLSHIRPYPPQSIMEYLSNGWSSGHPQSLGIIKGEYLLLALEWRHLPLLSGLIHQPLLIRFLEVLAAMGLRSLRRSGYLLVLKKM